jgi:hypothetical protein
MSFETGKGLKSLEITPNGGMNEISAVTAIPLTQALLMENWRISTDGLRNEKRDGLELVYGGFITDVFGFTTYYDSTPAFCQLAICEDKIWRKIASADWAAIHTWSSSLAHPLRPLEIQGKQFIISEIQNKMILGSGTVVQAGISAPTTIPTLTASFEETLLAEDCAAITDWTDADAGSGATSQATYDSKSTMKFLNTGASGDISSRYRTVAGIGPEYGVELSAYFDTLGAKAANDYFYLSIRNGRVHFQLIVDSNDVYVKNGSTWVSAGVKVYQDKWVTLKFYVNSVEPGEEYCEVFMDGISIGEYYIECPDTTSSGKVQISLYGSTAATTAYLDYINIGSTAGGKITGMRRYAVAYARSGNYGNLSNPIKSLVGSKTFVGTGLNDLTPGGDYTADVSKNIRVQIDAVGATDTIKWSEDNGVTWSSTGIPLTTTVYLPYGIELAFAATTGHTINEYWNFTCSALAVDCVHQKVTFASIPVSSDTQVDQRHIFRTLAGGEDYYLVAIINDNTTTTFVDNLHDTALGVDMEEDHDIVPLGKYSTWWDDRLWVADDDDNLVYYSKTSVPDAFYIADNWISAKSGESQDVITGIYPYKSYLYVFKRNSIKYIAKKDDGTYGIYDCESDHGCRAPWSIVGANGLLTFLSERGWESFNGCSPYPIPISKPVERTFKTIDDTKLDLICAAHHRKYNEIMLTISDRTSGSARTAVCNYINTGDYLFYWHKTPSFLGEARDSSKRKQFYLGTRDGYVYKVDSGTQDGTTNITAKIRLPWIKGDVYQYWRYLEIEHELPTGNTLTLNMYINMQKTTVRTKSFAGVTPSATDQDYRWPIKDKMEMALRGKYAAIELTNAENLGSSLKINSLKIFYQDMRREGKITPD